MQYPLVSCQLRASEIGHVAQKSAPTTERACGRKKRWAPDPAETVAQTASRRSGPRAWLCALERAVAADLIPGFNATTQAIVDVLAGRMDFDTGHARYVMQDVMERTGLGKTAVTNHVKMLRAGGWLAWVEHGSLRNVLRGLGKGGYARTATVYAATIPPAYDALEGNILVGTGYDARVILDYRDKAPVDTPGNAPVENVDDETSRTPSRWVVKGEGQVQVVGGKGTSTASAAAAKSTHRKKRKLTVNGYKITGPRIERARQLAKSVRPLVNWVQGASLDELSWVFLDLVARDWTEPRIVAWLGKLGQEIGAPRWRPRFPHRVIAAALRRDDKTAASRAVPADLEAEEYLPEAVPNAGYMAAREALRQRFDGHAEPLVSYGAYGENDAVELDGWEFAQQREAAKSDPALVLAHARICGRESAIAAFGTLAVDILDGAAEFARAGYLTHA